MKEREIRVIERELGKNERERERERERMKTSILME
jgi:hypothetical protein